MAEKIRQKDNKRMKEAEQICLERKRKEAQQREEIRPKGPCGSFSNPVVQSQAKNILIDMTRYLDLGPQAIFQKFANTLTGEMFRVADALPSKLGPESWAIYNQLLQQARTADFKTWTECFPGLQQLVNDADKAKVEAEAKAATAKAEAARPINRLRRAYLRYLVVQRCYDVRLGYQLVYINEVELERAKSAVSTIETNLLKEDSSIDTDAVWQQAVRTGSGIHTLDGDFCQKTYNELLGPAPYSPRKDFGTQR